MTTCSCRLRRRAHLQGEPRRVQHARAAGRVPQVRAPRPSAHAPTAPAVDRLRQPRGGLSEKRRTALTSSSDLN
eukprot:6177788-Pleurochrysis_carterae.AAC.2